MIVRKAGLSDLADIIEVFKRSIQAISNEHYSEAEKAEWLKTAENKKRWLYALENQIFFITEIDSKAVGFISLENNEYIDFIYVHPNYLRKGIAQALLNQVEQLAINSQSTKLKSHVSKAAIQFFEKNGFSITQENKNKRGDEVLINHTAEKLLV